MSCACENRRMSKELERFRRLAKALARMEDETVAIYLNEDGTYGFTSAKFEIEKEIVEFISPY